LETLIFLSILILESSDVFFIIAFKSEARLFSMHLVTFPLISLLFSLASSFSIPNFIQGHLLSARSESSPNPIATQYPNNVTGTINGTIAVVPIPYKLARSIIPAQYNILRKAYECQLFGLPRDSYPVMILLSRYLLISSGSDLIYSLLFEPVLIMASDCFL
jgi:hypothetical protein